MAVLGAKRPQDRGWQWVVLSLWITLLVPAVQAMAASAADKFEPFITWRLLVAGLIGMGLLNYLLTRFAIAAIFFAIGQTLLMSDYLLHFSANVELMRFFGYVGGPAMILVACAVAEFLHSRPPSDGLHPLSHRWLTFRDGWGAFWGLRVMHRVNQTAELSGWPVRLDWQGFVTASGDLSVSPMIDAATAAQMQQTLDSLLRRFERP